MAKSTTDKPGSAIDPIVEVKTVVIKPRYFISSVDPRIIMKFDEGWNIYCQRHVAASEKDAEAALLKAVRKFKTNVRVVEVVEQMPTSSFKRLGEPEVYVKMRMRGAPFGENDLQSDQEYRDHYGK